MRVGKYFLDDLYLKNNIKFTVLWPWLCRSWESFHVAKFSFPALLSDSMDARSGGNEADSVSFRLITSEYAFKGPWGYKESFEETDRDSCSPGTLASKSALSCSHLRMLFQGWLNWSRAEFKSTGWWKSNCPRCENRPCMLYHLFTVNKDFFFSFCDFYVKKVNNLPCSKELSLCTVGSPHPAVATIGFWSLQLHFYWTQTVFIFILYIWQTKAFKSCVKCKKPFVKDDVRNECETNLTQCDLMHTHQYSYIRWTI